MSNLYPFNAILEFNERIDSSEVNKVRASLLLNTLKKWPDDPAHFSVLLLSEYGEVYLFEQVKNTFHKRPLLYRIVIQTDDDIAHPGLEFLTDFKCLTVEENMYRELEERIKWLTVN